MAQLSRISHDLFRPPVAMAILRDLAFGRTCIPLPTQAFGCMLAYTERCATLLNGVFAMSDKPLIVNWKGLRRPS